MPKVNALLTRTRKLYFIFLERELNPQCVAFTVARLKPLHQDWPQPIGIFNKFNVLYVHAKILNNILQDSDQTKRWSTAVVCREDSSRATHKVHPMDGTADHGQSHGHFQRQSNRLSMQFSGPGLVFIFITLLL